MHLTVTLALGNLLAQIRQPNITSVAGNQILFFCIDLHARIFGTIGEPFQRDIRGAVASRRTFDLLMSKREFTT